MNDFFDEKSNMARKILLRAYDSKLSPEQIRIYIEDALHACFLMGQMTQMEQERKDALDVVNKVLNLPRHGDEGNGSSAG